jgi:hypothetical protein
MTRLERNLAAFAVGILLGAIAVTAFATVEVVAPVVAKQAAAAATVAAPAAAQAAAPAAASTAPAAATPAGARTDSWLVQGGGAFLGVLTYFYAVICTAERGNNPGTWFAEHCRPQDWWPR